jgi:hypothetical protein
VQRVLAAALLLALAMVLPAWQQEQVQAVPWVPVLALALEQAAWRQGRAQAQAAWRRGLVLELEQAAP